MKECMYYGKGTDLNLSIIVLVWLRVIRDVKMLRPLLIICEKYRNCRWEAFASRVGVTLKHVFDIY